MPAKLYRYEGYYYHDDGTYQYWVAVIGGSDYTRRELEKARRHDTGEQLAEIERALSELPGEDVEPNRGQRRRPKPVDGDLEG